MISGKDKSGQENAVIVDLKQWSDVQPLLDKILVRTVINGGESNEPHT